MSRTVRLGTRASALAMAQSRSVADALSRSTGLSFEFVPVTTKGDVTPGSLASLGGTGVFATALREALLSGECDLIVHSLKDLPTAPYPGLTIAAIPPRADARDLLVSTGGAMLAALAPGARVGTGAPRRVAQVLRARPDVEVIDIRGNVDTRLAKVRTGKLDAVILAAAGLGRLGLLGEASEVFDLAQWPTAAGQGALAIEARVGSADAVMRDALATIDDAEARLTATAEREVLAGLESGCAAPVGITACVSRGQLTIAAAVYGVRGAQSLVRAVTGPIGDAAVLADRLAASLLDAGAHELASPREGT